MRLTYQCESFCDHRWSKNDYEEMFRYQVGDIACPKCGHEKFNWKKLTPEEQTKLKKDAAIMTEMYHEAQQQLRKAK